MRRGGLAEDARVSRTCPFHSQEVPARQKTLDAAGCQESTWPYLLQWDTIWPRNLTEPLGVLANG